MERIKLHLIVFTSVIDLYREHFESNSYLDIELLIGMNKNTFYLN